MEIKEVKQTTFYGRQLKTSLKTIHTHVKVLPEEILEEIKQKELTVNGEQVWVYKGADGNPDTVFNLTVGFPVDMKEGIPEIEILKKFKCAAIIHKGDWGKFGDTYGKIIEEINKNGFQMTGESREIYHQVDFDNMENNVTEVQIGIK